MLRLKSFYVNGVELQLQVFPNGDANANRNFTSIFLQNNSVEDIKADFDVSMGQVKVSASAERIEADGGWWGWSRFFDHDSDSEPENNDEELEIVCNVKRVWKELAARDKSNLETKMDILTSKVQKNQIELENKIKNLEVQVKQLLEVKNNNAPKVVPKPECPVCMEEMGPGTRIMQCEAGHFLCWSCSLKPEIGRRCPSCREPFVGRAHGMEAYLKTVFG